MEPLEQKKVRSSSLELLRIVAMLMIIATHAAARIGNGVDWGVLSSEPSLNLFSIFFIGTYGQTGVFLFVILSSWFLSGKESKTHYGKLFKLYAQAFFISVLFLVFAVLYGLPAGKNQVLTVLLTPVNGNYCFLRTYILFYLLVPFAQDYMLKIDDKTHLRFVLVFSIVYPFMRFFMPNFQSEFGYIGTFFYIFFLVSYLKKHEENFIEKHCRILFVSLLAFMWLSLIGASFFCYRFGISENHTRAILVRIFAGNAEMQHIFMIILAVCLFYIFKDFVHIGFSKIINVIASSTFGVYIFHENFFLNSHGENGITETCLLWEQWLHLGEHFENDVFFPLYLIGCMLLVFCTCSVLELFRQLVLSGCKRLFRLCRKQPAV